MSETPYVAGAARPWAPGRTISTSALLGQVMFLVALAVGFAALGSVIGKDLSFSTARALSFAGFGMLLVSSFAGERFRVGGFAMGWLFATALVIGLGLGPWMSASLEWDPKSFTAALAGTGLTVLGMGAAGFALSKDLARWMRPLSLVVLGLVLVSSVLVVFSIAPSPIVALAIYGFSAALILVDFNYLRKHGTEDDAIMLATGIFVSIVNIFTSLLSLFQR